MKLAVVGSTGLVGTEIIKILEERKFPVKELIPIASDKSEGKKVVFNNKEYETTTLKKGILKNPNLALFSAGSTVSKNWAPAFTEIGCRVVDNSSYWRMSPNHKLIVPEINGNKITKKDLIIANPNCSTIQLVMALNPLHIKKTIKRVIVSTYQSVSGSGYRAIKELREEEKKRKVKQKLYPHKIYNNIIPQVDLFEENAYTKEEMKLINETKKILDNKIKVTATAVRVPVIIGHSESVNVSFKEKIEIGEIKEILKGSNGISLLDNPNKSLYPMPLHSIGSDSVFIGRIRKDLSNKNTINMWVVSNNLRKGAATNAVQIAEIILKKTPIK